MLLWRVSLKKMRMSMSLVFGGINLPVAHLRLGRYPIDKSNE